LVGINTDTQEFPAETEADSKLLIGGKRTGGRGSGSVPKIGEEAAQESIEDIKQTIHNSDIVFVTAGLGGGTGTGATPVIAQAAQEEGVLVISLVTTPFSAQDKKQQLNANTGLEKLRTVSDTVIVLPNDGLGDALPSMPLQDAYRKSNQNLASIIERIIKMITEPGLINTGFADIRRFFENGGISMVGVGEGTSENKLRDSVVSAMRSPFLLDVDINKNSHPAMVSINHSPDLTIQDCMETVKNLVPVDSKSMWDAQVEEEFKQRVETIIIYKHISNPQLYKHGNFKQESDTDFTDIDYVD
jgi:cell division protein FtsZ